MKLSADTLGDLHPEIARPAYDRSKVTAGILHVGLGNFHRAHQAVYLDDLLAKGGAPDWGILGAGVMPADTTMREGLKEQDCLYTVLEQDASGDAGRIIGVMTDFAPVSANHAGILRAMENPAIRIVSLTVTEGGYFVSAETGGFNPDHPAILADIANPDAPGTIFGAIVAGLRARRAAGQVPFTVMSCDNVPHNGDVCRAAVLGIAAGQDTELAAWIGENVAFPNGMVDRITPATTEARVTHLRETFGIEDARPVFCEPFRQWVLEDKFTAGRPALEEVGVQFVPDVTPYEHMKIRILNGGHAMIAYAGALLGLTYAHDAMAHELVRGFLEKVETEEVIPIVPPVPDTSLTEYFKLIEARFSNPRVEDTLARLCHDGSNRQPKFIVPSAADCLAAGRSVDGLALASALWCRYCFGTGELHEEIPENDPAWDRLVETSKEARNRPEAWLEMSDIYGEVGQSPIFREAFARALNSLWVNGTEATLKTYLDGALS
ncbi:mannitol dehydrogenase family protein [Tropicimonas sp. TH_r6]|uniref:mannitol dehydrogenase family protein n=1 Tax=Tropicimonas sp. TH_r6 TaxID=3082085 RepID=UPI00295540B8|nr:mannitol dehydrogenase family protein [Tropicimonas sp. TH_r6]MDV7141847.1 mannitol dehydrogenase family protein [Tropicimonas sp. TH_r6]